ncbi:MAG: iron-sulfur cluster assembly scaffold protein [Lachnospiraceae bacterium]|nr:iron-sulfur cluster assembly scaffold protein [Lachnospiraceae bacterium]
MDKNRIIAAARNGTHRGIPDTCMGSGFSQDPSCKDVLQYYFSTEREIITDIRYTITETSCYPSKACGEAAAELAQGKPVMEAYTIDADKIGEAVGGLDMEHRHCAQMAELALKRAVLDYARRRAGNGGIPAVMPAVPAGIGGSPDRLNA